MSGHASAYLDALRAIWRRSAYDRGFITNPFAGDDVARLGLARTARLLEELGPPERAVRLLHVAGSKGKGSTCAFASEVLTAHGLRTGQYTSPHLHTFRERIAVDGSAISEEAFARLTERALWAVHRVEQAAPALGEITAFELATAMALTHFAAEACDVAVIEVGLGGTLDATNVITPAGCVITALDFEHTRILGSTLPEIAANKAGIIKPAIPVVTAHYSEDARRVVAAVVERNQSRWLELGRQVRRVGSWHSFSVDGPWGSIAELRTSLPGDHQADNAALAIAGSWFLLGAALDSDRARRGISATRWPGRFEIVETGERTIVLDGAHTPAAAAALAETISTVFPGTLVTIVLGVLRDKDPAAIVSALAGVAAEFVAVTPPGPRGLDARELTASLANASGRVRVAGDWSEALATSKGIVVATGSLATVGAAREALGLAVADPIPLS